MLDLHAPIEPGKSAAGFEIGQLLSDIESELKDRRDVTYVPGFDLNAALSANAGALVIRGMGSGASIHFGQDVVRLIFSSDGRLGCIYVFDQKSGTHQGMGYLGSYKGVGTGEPLSKLTDLEPYEYDDGDEMYYRLDAAGDYLPGLAIAANNAEVSEHGSTLIDGYCVHDWTVFNAKS
ncbi:hypothetical protein [Roseateles sp.]|uniref:hypothetical protein n=1 Tax=Roseateles sp. TaxID=1971397 RepID=UPI002F4070AC